MDWGVHYSPTLWLAVTALEVKSINLELFWKGNKCRVVRPRRLPYLLVHLFVGILGRLHYFVVIHSATARYI